MFAAGVGNDRRVHNRLTERSRRWVGRRPGERRCPCAESAAVAEPAPRRRLRRCGGRRGDRAEPRNRVRGRIWPVNPRRDSIEGIACYRSAAELPEAPDAAFVAVPKSAAVAAVAELAARGAGEWSAMRRVSPSTTPRAPNCNGPWWTPRGTWR
ncbi:CoA-binding protein [Saccharopolyspora gloriosae]|uniref:CoA-binding protein n=1 Tax=Saccharopolyspora gloriosae TaxID=455344 RepID=UPI001FB658DC|nr:CoA-binding protein [Saccharopolyspora gloriosae]